MTTQEFNTCVDNYADNLYRFILKQVKDKDKAKDIVQDTYEKLWVKISDMESSNAKSYMFTTAYRTMIDFLRRDKKQTLIKDHHLNNKATKNNYSDLKEVINLALDKLPEIQKTVVLLRDYEGYNYVEIGEITDLTEAQVKVYIYRARHTMKLFLGSLEQVL